MKKLIIILAVILISIFLASCSDFCVYCRALDITETEIEGSESKQIKCNNCGRTYGYHSIS